MRYLVAIFIPPLAILMCGRAIHFVLNLVMWIGSILLIPVFGIGIIGWFICMAYALSICKMSSFDKRVNRVISAMQSQGQGQRV